LNLQSLVHLHWSSVLEEYGFVAEPHYVLDRDPKSGQEIEAVEFNSPVVRLLVERRDGEINAKIRNRGPWQYVRSFDAARSTVSIEALLHSIPNLPLSDSEMLHDLEQYLRVALQVLTNET